MTILSACISEAHNEQSSLVVSSPFTDGVHRERTNLTKSGDISSCERRGRWEIRPNSFGHKRNHLESVSR